MRATVLRNNTHVKYNITSSIWTSIKPYLSIVLDNSAWLLGDGSRINFWLDRLLSKPLSSMLEIPDYMHKSLKGKVIDYMANGSWNILEFLHLKCPALSIELKQICIPIDNCKDQLIWSQTDSGKLSFRYTFNYSFSNGQVLHWTKVIWNRFIPPSRTFLLWRIYHN